MLETYSKNRLTWPLALGFSFLAWIFNGWLGLGGTVVHSVVVSPFLDSLLGMLVCAFSIYLIAELNTRYSLLSNTDRTVSMTFMLLLAMSTFLHPLQKPHLVMVCYLVGYLILLGAYQSRQAPVQFFSVHLALGVASCMCPQLVWLIPMYWVSLVILRAFGLRCLVASILGVSTPYWFWGILSLWLGGHEAFSIHIDQMTMFGSGGFEMLSSKQVWAFWVALSMFLVGGLDFFINIHQNRSRTRVNYYVVCVQGAWSFIFLWMEPQLFNSLFPLCLVNATIVWGHFTSLSKGRIPDVLLSVIMILWFITTIFIG